MILSLLLTLAIGQVPASAIEAHTGKSGRTLFVTSSLMAPSLVPAPVLKVNGTPIAMTPGPVDVARAPYVKDKSGFYSFRLASPVRPFDVLTLDGMPVRNSVGRAEYPTPEPTMALGVNIAGQPLNSFAQHCPVRNWANRIIGWDGRPPLDAAGNPTVNTTATIVQQSFPDALGGTLPFPPGLYTLAYDALDPATVVSLESGSWDYTSTARPDLNATPSGARGIRRVYDIQPTPGRPLRPLWLRVRVAHPANQPRIANLYVAPPGNDPDPDPLAPEQSFLDQLSVGGGRGPAAIRWAGATLDWEGTSNLVEAADLPRFGPGGGKRTITASVTGLRPPVLAGLVVSTSEGDRTPPDLSWCHRGRRWVSEATTAAPHGFTTGQTATIRLAAPVAAGVSGIAVRIGGTVLSTVYVTGPTTFLVVGGDVALPPAGGPIDAEIPLTGATATVDISSGSLLPIEFAAAATARFKGADLWLSLPPLASDACLDAIAAKLLANLPPGHRVIIEYANEAWNWGFKLATYCSAMTGLLDGAFSPGRYYVRRSAAMTARIKTAFTAAGRPDDVLHALCWQWGGNAADTYAYAASIGIKADIVAGAPYMGLPAAWSAACADWGPAEMNDLVRHYIRLDPDMRFDASQQRAAVDAYRTATGKPVLHYTYEGAIERPIPPGGAVARTWDAVQHPDAYDTERTYYGWLQEQGIQVHTHFASIATVMYGGSTWFLYSHQHQRAGRGDGSDGRPPNRMIGTSGTWIPNDSVRGQAWLDWQRDALLNR